MEENVAASLVIHMAGPYIHRLKPVQLTFSGEEPLRQSEAWLRGEPSIQELMSDPIIHLVMRRDGLTPEIVWAVIQAASAELQVKPKEVADEAKGVGSGVTDLWGSRSRILDADIGLESLRER